MNPQLRAVTISGSVNILLLKVIGNFNVDLYEHCKI